MKTVKIIKDAQFIDAETVISFWEDVVDLGKFSDDLADFILERIEDDESIPKLVLGGEVFFEEGAILKLVVDFKSSLEKSLEEDKLMKKLFEIVQELSELLD